MTDYNSIEVIAKQAQVDDKYAEKIEPIAEERGFLQFRSGFKRVADDNTIDFVFPDGQKENIPFGTCYTKTSVEEGRELETIIGTYRNNLGSSVVSGGASWLLAGAAAIGFSGAIHNYVHNHFGEYSNLSKIIDYGYPAIATVAVTALALAIAVACFRSSDNEFRKEFDKWQKKIKGVFKHSETPYDPEILKEAFKEE